MPAAAVTLPSDIQLPWPSGRTASRRKAITLPPQKVHPVVRIAHRARGLLRIPPRIILDHELVLILKGAGRLMAQSAAIPFAAHHFFFIEPFAPHAFESEGAVEHLAVHFDFAPGVPPPSARLQDRRPYQVRLTQDLRIPQHLILEKNDPLERALFDVIAARGRPGNLGSLATTSHLLRALVLLLERAAGSQFAPSAGLSTDHIRIQRAVGFLEQNLAERISAADLAAAADTSPSHFNRIFRQWSASSPMEFLKRRRIEQARTLLADAELSIKQIAARTGFDDPFHFSRVFRQLDGLSPSQFRAAVFASTRGLPENPS